MNGLGNQLLELAKTSTSLRAFLRVIREGETSQDDDAYRTIVGGDQTEHLRDHPRTLVRIERLKISSTAAGAYQFLSRTWDECAKALDLKDFSPDAQDAAAVYLIRRRKALTDVLAGRFEDAVRKCNREWASLPESPYGQGELTWERARRVFDQWSGASAPAAPPPVPPPAPELKKEGKNMGSFAVSAVTSLLGSLPSLVKIFGTEGSATSERNAKAVEIAADVITKAVGARNAQEAVEIIKADPESARVAESALKSSWADIAEAGGGGIEGARKADAERMSSDRAWWDSVLRSHSFWMGTLLLPLVYMIVLSIIGVLGEVAWSMDVRAAIAGSIVGSIIGGLVGYYFGQTTSRNRGPSGAAGE